MGAKPTATEANHLMKSMFMLSEKKLLQVKQASLDSQHSDCLYIISVVCCNYGGPLYAYNEQNVNTQHTNLTNSLGVKGRVG